MNTLELHPYVELYPPMRSDEFERLKEDIRINGVKHPIVVYNNLILDGRNRYNACKELGVVCPVTEWDNNGSLLDYVISANSQRRDLTASQKAAVALLIKPLFAKEFKEHQRLGMSKLTDPEEAGTSRKYAAKVVGASDGYVGELESIKRVDETLFWRVHKGEITIQEAKRKIRHDEVDKIYKITEGQKYRVIYADPPWQYNDKGLDDYGHAERHYPTMSIDELCALGVDSIVEDDAVLFLWVTAPLLEDSFKVIKAWGFEYKTYFVWDKVKHNFGHYSSVRHESLLVCTRGSCTPDNLKLFDSVQTIERSDKHSEKPEKFREIIDTLYPYGRRCELFARSKHDNWDTFASDELDSKREQQPHISDLNKETEVDECA